MFMQLEARIRGTRLRAPNVCAGLTIVCWLLLYGQAVRVLVVDWTSNADAAHGILLAALAFVLAWRASRSVVSRSPAPYSGAAILALAVLLRIAAALAAERYTISLSMLLSLLGLTVFYSGWGVVRRGWLAFAALVLAVPPPELLVSTLTLPLQLIASHVGARLLSARHVPVLLVGNIIRLPGHDLFVAEACSGMRSLSALLSLGLVLGGLSLRHPLSRAALLATVIPLAIALNGVRVFVTGFLVFFAGPSTAQGFLHFTEGWLVFLLAITLLGALVMLARKLENLRRWSVAA